MTTPEIEDIYEVRELLEGGAARVLAGLRPRDRARAVAALLQNLAGCLARLGADKSAVVTCTC
jgi:DNA-binding GntR family transcriptional regulator